MNCLADYFLNDPVGRDEFWKMYSDSQRKILEEATDGDDFLPFIEASIKDGRYFSDYDIYEPLFWLLEDAYNPDYDLFARAFGRLFRPDSEAYRFAVDYILEQSEWMVMWMVAEEVVKPTKAIADIIVGVADMEMDSPSDPATHKAFGRAMKILDKAGLLDRPDMTDDMREYYLG